MEWRDGRCQRSGGASDLRPGRRCARTGAWTTSSTRTTWRFHNGRAVVRELAQEPPWSTWTATTSGGAGGAAATPATSTACSATRAGCSSPAFGRFETHRGWAGRIDRAGIVFDAATDENVLEGLSGAGIKSAPWTACGPSATPAKRNLIGVDPGARLGRAGACRLGNWTRGLAITADAIYVGPERGAARHRGRRRPGRGGRGARARGTWEPMRRSGSRCPARRSTTSSRSTTTCRERQAVAQRVPDQRLARGRTRSADGHSSARSGRASPSTCGRRASALPGGRVSGSSLDAVAPPRGARRRRDGLIPLTITNTAGARRWRRSRQNPVLAAARWVRRRDRAPGSPTTGPRTRLPHAIMAWRHRPAGRRVDHPAGARQGSTCG